MERIMELDGRMAVSYWPLAVSPAIRDYGFTVARLGLRQTFMSMSCCCQLPASTYRQNDNSNIGTLNALLRANS